MDNIDTSSGSLFDGIPAEELMKRTELMDLIRSEMQQAKESKEVLNQDAVTPLVRPGIVRKSDSETAKVVTIQEGELPSFRNVKALVKWLKDAFSENRTTTILSTNQQVLFSNTGSTASVKRSKEKFHDNVYTKLRDVVKNAEYDSFEPKDERHPNLAGQDVYVSAIRIGTSLYRVKLKSGPTHHQLDFLKLC